MEGASAIVTAMTGAVTTIASDCTEMVGAILPVALPVLGIVIAVSFGLKFVKKIMK